MESMKNSVDSSGSDHFVDSRLYKILNGQFGIIAMVVSMTFVAIMLLIFLVRIFQYPHLRQYYFIGDNTRSIPTRILKTITFLLLAAGFVGLITYDVNKMINDPPKLSVIVEENTSSPSILFCYIRGTGFSLKDSYYASTRNNDTEHDLTSAFSNKTRKTDDCYFFDGSSSPKPKDEFGGLYHTTFIGHTRLTISIGDTNNVDWDNQQGNTVFNEIGTLTVNISSGLFKYTETRHRVLDGGYTHRNFQLFPITLIEPEAVNVDETSIIIQAPDDVVIHVEEPSIKLADLFSDIGSYFGILGIIGFFFGSKKVDPFGFVSRFVFIKQDRAKLFKELEKMKSDKNVKLSISGEEEKYMGGVTETSNNSNQAELKNMLANYYIVMDLYERAVKTPDV